MKEKFITREEIKKLLPKRAKDTYKYVYGHVLVLAGSVGMTGAAALTGEAAIRSGAGLVTLGIPKSLNQVMAVKLTEVMTKPLAETDEQTLSLKALDSINNIMQLRQINVAVIGPGLSTHPETVELVRSFIATSKIPLVVDADALNALVGKLEILKAARGPIVVTPHAGELGRLIAVHATEIKNAREKFPLMFSRDMGVVCVLKGYHTIITDGTKVAVNDTGNPGMATAGSGDVLSGLLGGLIAQGLEPMDAAKAAVYIHGLAGDLAIKETTEMGLIASDIIKAIPQALKLIGV
jgi:ADP-dependent NAD(P)H-hydrate dehydratase / NAD(P)H-hydrate epimerase